MTETVKTIFVGAAGSGKTIAYRDFPRPLLVQDTDNKVYTIRYLFDDRFPMKELKDYSEFDTDSNDIQFIKVNSQNFEAYYRDTKAILTSPPMRDGKPGTWVLDSLTSIADNTINYGLAMRPGTGKSMGVVPIPDLPEWMGESMFLSSLFTDVKNLPCHVVLTAHLVTTERELMVSKAERLQGLSGGKKITRQLMTGGTKIGAKIPVYFSEVWNFQSVPPIDYGGKPSKVVYTSTTEECDIARTKLPLDYSIDITFDPQIDRPTLWQTVQAAMEKANDAKSA